MQSIDHSCVCSVLGAVLLEPRQAASLRVMPCLGFGGLLPTLTRLVQDAYGGRILYTPLTTGGVSSGPKAATPSAAAADGAKPAPQDSPAKPAHVSGATALSTAAAPAGEDADAQSTSLHRITNGVHNPDVEQSPQAASAAADESQATTQEQPASDGSAPPPGLLDGSQSSAEQSAQHGAALQQYQQVQQQQEQQEEHGRKQQSIVFDGHDLSPGTQMLHVGDEVEFTLVHDRMSAEPRATRVRP